MVSIILPVLNEGENLKILVPEIYKILKKEIFEIIVIDDDSKDNTDQILKGMKQKVTYIARKDKKGLSSAVIKGFDLARGDVYLVMDSDLSHPVDVIPRLLKEIRQGADIAIASRYIQGGGVTKWPWPRKLISVFATLLARPIVPVKDPLAGFFCLKKNVIKNVSLNPIGFKILLEIIVKGHHDKIMEIPYMFRDRFAGESKADIKIYFQYNLHLVKLYFYKFKNLFQTVLK
ncbi:MAG: polyprenol monophosphomannose synthase [Spirochaetes bacterium]|nr:polyprenol monophosphomannose synthase [Spirochaetota bacterium]